MTQLSSSISTIALALVITGLSACDSDKDTPLRVDGLIADDTNPVNSNTPNSTVTSLTDEPMASEIDGRWLSDCVTRFPQNPILFEQEYLTIRGSSYERTINYYQDSDCSVPTDISFLRVRSSDLQYLNGTVQTALGSASQIVVTEPTIDFDARLLTVDEAALYDPALYFHEFYLLASDGRLRFGSLDTLPGDQFEQTLDSPHLFTAQ